MNAKKRIFKEKLDAVLIPGTTPKDEWSVLLQPICEYANSIMPSRLFRYRSCNEMQFDAFLITEYMPSMRNCLTIHTIALFDTIKHFCMIA